VSTRFETAFDFTFMLAGLTLILMVVLFAIGQVCRRVLTCLGLSLIALVARDENNHPVSPWLLPTLTLAFFLVVVLSHFLQRPRLGLSCSGHACR